MSIGSRRWSRLTVGKNFYKIASSESSFSTMSLGDGYVPIVGSSRMVKLIELYPTCSLRDPGCSLRAPGIALETVPLDITLQVLRLKTRATLFRMSVTSSTVI